MALNINGTTGISGVDGSASAPALQVTDSNTGINFASDTVNINTGGVTRATVESNGRLGIGTASPSSLVHLNSSADTQLILSSDSDTFKLSCFSNGEAGIETANANPLRFFTNATERMRIESAGNLQLARDKYLGTVASGQSTINIGTSGGAQIGFLKSGTNDDELKFYTHQSGVAHAERMSIDPSGDLRVGRIYSNTTSGGANVRVQSDGLMQRDTSSRRY